MFRVRLFSSASHARDRERHEPCQGKSEIRNDGPNPSRSRSELREGASLLSSSPFAASTPFHVPPFASVRRRTPSRAADHPRRPLHAAGRGTPSLRRPRRRYAATPPWTPSRPLQRPTPLRFRAPPLHAARILTAVHAVVTALQPPSRLCTRPLHAVARSSHSYGSARGRYTPLHAARILTALHAAVTRRCTQLAFLRLRTPPVHALRLLTALHSAVSRRSPRARVRPRVPRATTTRVTPC